MQTKNVKNLVETSVMLNNHPSLRLLAVACAITFVTACGAQTAKDSLRTSTPQDGEANPNDGATPDVVDNGPKDEPKDPHKGKPDPIDPNDPAAIQKIPVAAGLRNYEQINATMSAVTGVPRTNATINALYRNELSTALPTDNDVKAFIGSGQVAIYKLAVEYCDALTLDATLRASFFPGVNFAAAPATALNAAGKDAVAEALITNIWGKELEGLPPHAESTDKVVALIDDLLIGKNVNTVTVTRAVVTGACTAVLASAPVTLF